MTAAPNSSPWALRAAFWILPALFLLALYWAGLQSWFQDDDFVWLKQRLDVQGGFPLWNALFSPTGHGTFRPLSERGFFILFSSLFGFDGLPYRICVFVTQLANLALVASIVWRLSGSRLAGFLAPLFWTANSNMGRAMAWNSAYMQILCGFFILLAFHFLLRYVETGRRRYYVLQWISFVTGFGAMESIVVYPALATLYTFLYARKYWRGTLPLWLVSVLFVVFHMTLAPKQASGPYAMHLDFTIARTFYRYWELSWVPLNMEKLTRIPGWTGQASLLLWSAALAIFMVWSALRKQWLPLFLFAWYVLLLSPLLPLADHVSEYLLTLPLCGLAMLSAHFAASAWRGPMVAKAAAVALAGVFFLTSAPTARKSVGWWSDRSQGIERKVLGVAAARELHPGKTILLTGVDDHLFWGAIYGQVFPSMGLHDIHLAPGSESTIEPHPDLANVSSYVLHRSLVEHALDRDRVVVYELGGPRPRNITRQYAKTLPSGAPADLPRRVDVAAKLADPLLGAGWYPSDGTNRWMARSAKLRMGGPASTAQKLYITGYCSAIQTRAGPVRMSVAVEGRPPREVSISEGDTAFHAEFNLPPEMAGRPSMEISVEVDRTFNPEGSRELGLSFGVFEIR